MALACCSLSLLMQVHEAAAVVESGGDAGAEWRPPPPPRVQQRAGRWRRWLVHQVGSFELPTSSTLPVGDYFLYKSICSFVNVDLRPIRVRRASQVPQGRVPRGVHGKAR